jgi:acetolactate synthase-1/2/3 large subunit
VGSLPKPCTLQIKVDPVKPTMPMWSYPIEVALTADTGVALPLLEQALVRLATANLQQRWTGRRQAAEAEITKLRDEAKRRATSDSRPTRRTRCWPN